jgi:septum formation protein
MLREKLKNYKLILASGSPRRHQFFKELDVDFIVQIREVIEKFPNKLKGAEITDYLANLKSQAFTNLAENDLLVTSDTIVWSNDKALGKPKNKEEAYTMLKELSGQKHEVITSISIRTSTFQKIINDTTTVYFKEISDKEITYYIDNYQPFDKAGAYGIQEWLGLIAVDKIEGSYFNVAGLPVHKLYDELMNLPSI